MPPIENDTGKSELKTQIQLLIDSNQVMVFSKSYCPFCVKVKDLFKELKVDCNVVELDLIENGTTYQDMLLEMTGQKTVPNVFINKTHLGGCDKTMQVRAERTFVHFTRTPGNMGPSSRVEVFNRGSAAPR
ncbi:unnamed protein product, partial [Menidia menidia]